MSATPKHLKSSDGRGAHLLHRLVRRVVAMLLGEHNATNLYGEDKTTEQFEAAAKRIGASVVALDLPAGNYLHLFRMVYPLPNSKEEEGQRKENQVALGNGLGLDGDGGDETSAANGGECVPPFIDLKPGERITHVMVWPNDRAQR